MKPEHRYEVHVLVSSLSFLLSVRLSALSGVFRFHMLPLCFPNNSVCGFDNSYEHWLEGGGFASKMFCSVGQCDSAIVRLSDYFWNWEHPTPSYLHSPIVLVQITAALKFGMFAD